LRYKIQNIKFLDFIYILIISLCIVYINAFNFLNTVECFNIRSSNNGFKAPFLKTYLIGSTLHPTYIYGDFNYNYINDLCIKISQTNLNNYSFRFAQYNDQFNKPFPRKSPLSHPNILINDFNLFDDVIVSLTSSHNNYNNNFNLLSNDDFFKKDKFQFVSNSFYFYDNKLIKEKQFDEGT
jgi:hypothetical protein